MSEPLTPDKGAIWQWMILPLRRYAKFSGRSGRREFWWFSAAQFVIYILLFALVFGGAISAAMQADEAPGDANVAPGLVGVGIAAVGLFFVYLALFVPTLAVTVRRLHDIGISGWVALPLYLAGWFLSIIGWIAYAIVMALPGKDEANRYGPPIYGDQLATVFE